MKQCPKCGCKHVYHAMVQSLQSTLHRVDAAAQLFYGGYTCPICGLYEVDDVEPTCPMPSQRSFHLPGRQRPKHIITKTDRIILDMRGMIDNWFAREVGLDNIVRMISSIVCERACRGSAIKASITRLRNGTLDELLRREK